MTAPVSRAKDLEHAPSQTWLVAVDIIDTVAQVRTRFDKAALAELTESIRANGILQPLLLRPGRKAGRYELIAGERRLRAARAAGLTHVPALTGQTDDQAKLRMQIAENVDRENLEPEEVAKAVRALYDECKDIGQVAAVMKRSKSWVSKYLAVTMRWNYRVRALLEGGHCYDLELLGALDQYADLAGYGGPVSHARFHEQVALVRAGKTDRETMRRLVAEAKTIAKERKAAEARRQASPASTKPAKVKPKRFNPKTAIRDLFHAAGTWHMWDGRTEIRPDDNAATYVEQTQRAAMLDVLRSAYDDGRVKAMKTDPYTAVLGKFYVRSYMEGHEHAAWIAGAFGRPLDIEQLLRDVMDARRAGRSVERLLEDGDEGKE